MSKTPAQTKRGKGGRFVTEEESAPEAQNSVEAQEGGSLVALVGVVPVWCGSQAYPRRSSLAGAGCEPPPMIRLATTK